jgi:uncharacterized protein YegL
MLSTRLITANNNINSYEFIPDNVVPLIERRTENGKIFGKLEVIASPPLELTADAAKYPPRNIIAGFLLDISGSMTGEKRIHSLNTIKQFAQISIDERNGKTIEQQPIHTWIYVITFNSRAAVAIPFQEITEETLPSIMSKLDDIVTDGSTNYEVAFKKQTEVIQEIIKVIAADPTRRQFHVMRIFETDGEITQGTQNTSRLYSEMRRTATATATAETTDTSHLQLTYEDYVIGYGTDLDFKCLKTLASPTSPCPLSSQQQREQMSTVHEDDEEQNTSGATKDVEYNCSSLVPVVNAKDIGWQVGEIWFKTIMRLAVKLQVSIESKPASAGVVELFEYQTHQWGKETIFHSIIHNEHKTMYIQFTPTADAAPDAPLPEILVTVRCENQFTGSRYTYEFSHQLCTSSADLLLTPDEKVQAVIPIIQGMIQIEGFKAMRELERDQYDKDFIVHEAYKLLRMLKSIHASTKTSAANATIAPMTANLITDMKLIVGLTAINSHTEQECIIHARRTTSAEQDMFNTGADVSSKYVEDEENYEEIAKEIIQRRDHQPQKERPAEDTYVAAAGADDNNNDDDSDDEFDAPSDAIPSRIATCMTASTPRNGGGYPRKKPSIVRILCARIALSKLQNKDRTPEQIYDEMKQESVHYRGEYNEDPSYFHSRDCDDNTFSTPSQDDEYTQRRMGMMRQMSTPLS